MKQNRIRIKLLRSLVFLAFALALTLFVLPSYFGGKYMHEMMADYIVYFRITFGIFTLAALLFFIIRRVTGYDEDNEILYSYNALLFTLSALIVSLVYDSYSAGFFMTVFLSAAVFRITLSLCPRDVPLLFVINGLHILLIYSIKTDLSTDSGELGFVSVFAFIIPVLSALLAVLLKKNDGRLRLFRRCFALTSPGSRYLPVYLSSAITIAGAVCAWMKYIPSIYTIAALAFLFIVTTVIRTVHTAFAGSKREI